MTLLTTQNPKLQKSRSYGYVTTGLHLAPATLAGGRNLCAHASDGCRAVCLNITGHGQFAQVQEARIRKTRVFFAGPKAFVSSLVAELERAERKATREGMRFAARLNLTSDVRWEMTRDDDGATVFDRLPSVQFYDYTKNPQRMLAWCEGKLPSNYHLTFSRSECNEAQCLKVMAAGGNVAAVFAAPPAQWNGRPVIDGDKSDLRFLDPRGVVVGLTAKGALGKKDSSGFVIR